MTRVLEAIRPCNCQWTLITLHDRMAVRIQHGDNREHVREFPDTVQPPIETLLRGLKATENTEVLLRLPAAAIEAVDWIREVAARCRNRGMKEIPHD